MSELRWILLGLGVLVIAGIYFWESTKQKRSRRSRVEILPSSSKDKISNISINPKKERIIDISGALATLNAYLKQSRKSSSSTDLDLDTDKFVAGLDTENLDFQEDGHVNRDIHKKNNLQEIMVIYITAEPGQEFKGPDILHAMDSADMQFGDMNIFHYYGPDKKHATRALLNLANIHEPGSFDIGNMNSFTTSGMALFMCLPAEIGGDIAFEIMLDTAHNLAYILGGELRGPDRKILDADKLNTMREIASRY